MLRPIDNYFLLQAEPAKSCVQFLRSYILTLHPAISEAWKYGMPFFCCNGKMCCYLWHHKKFNLPYIGIVEGERMTHPDLMIEKRARMKILLIDPSSDLPMEKIDGILKEMLALYII